MRGCASACRCCLHAHLYQVRTPREPVPPGLSCLTAQSFSASPSFRTLCPTSVVCAPPPPPYTHTPNPTHPPTHPAPLDSWLPHIRCNTFEAHSHNMGMQPHVAEAQQGGRGREGGHTVGKDASGLPVLPAGARSPARQPKGRHTPPAALLARPPPPPPHISAPKPPLLLLLPNLSCCFFDCSRVSARSLGQSVTRWPRPPQ